MTKIFALLYFADMYEGIQAFVFGMNFLFIILAITIVISTLVAYLAPTFLLVKKICVTNELQSGSLG